MIFGAEMPPTAGLPARFADFLPRFGFWRGKRRLTHILAQQFGLPPLQAECSGTACLIIALKTLQAMPQNAGRDEVVVPAYNCPLVILAIAHCGLKPHLCDTAPNSFDFDQKKLRQCVSGRTLAILPTHLGGQAADIAAAVPIARKQGAFIIEDAAQSFGAAPAAGIGRLGDIVFFSLAVGKGLTLYEGGLLTAATAEMRAALAAASEKLIPVRPLFEAKRAAQFFGYCCLYRPYFLSLAYGVPRRRALAKGQEEKAVGDIFSPDIPLHKISNMRASWAVPAAERLPQFLRRTREQARRRLPFLQRVAVKSGGRLRIIGAEDVEKAAWPFFMLLLPDKSSRDALLHKIWSLPEGVSRLFIHALGGYGYLQPYLREQPATANADNFSERMLTITNSLWFGNSRFEKLCHIIEQTLLTTDKNHGDFS